MSARFLGGALLLALVSSAGCGPRATPPPGQLLVYIDTDAIVPSNAVQSQSALRSPPLFDRIRVDGIHAGETCATCSREFDVFKETFEARGVSLGIVAPIAAGDSLRVRLYLSTYALDGLPPPEATVDVTAVLPALPAEGTQEETLLLQTATVGKPTQADLTPGPPTSSLVDTWPGAKRVDCGAPAKAGEVCIPGGAYWMGNPLAAHLGISDGDHLRLVVLSPFYMDSTETTVAAYRPAANTFGLGEEWSGQVSCDEQSYCTFTERPGPYDDYPMNCLSQAQAAEYCQMYGKELPSEAQFEYVASGLDSSSFIWGEDEPTCEDAVFQRAGLGFFRADDGSCRTSHPTDMTCGSYPAGGLTLNGPASVRTGLLDQLTVALPSSTGTVFGLVGNVSEFTRDAWNLLTDPCWSTPGVYTNPVCAANTGLVSIRGGDWTTLGLEARAAVRSMAASDTQFTPQAGFRCVRPVP